jgi:hypothetical protein
MKEKELGKVLVPILQRTRIMNTSTTVKETKVQTIDYKDYEIFVFQKTKRTKMISVHHKTLHQFFDCSSVEKAMQYIDTLMQLKGE